MRRKFNSLSCVVVDGVQYDALPTMKATIYNFYKSLFSESEPWRPKVDTLPLPLLQDSEKEFIEMPFSEEEVTKALLDCCGDKAPELDGMTMAFLQGNWDTVSGDVMRMFVEFFSSGRFVASLNASFTVHIPKKANVENIRDFWPISLVGCSHKLLSKVLTQRLRSIIGNLISENQNALVGGRQIIVIDAVLIAMDSKCGRTAPKRPHWKGFGVGRSVFSCRDMERNCRIRAILPFRDRNRNRDRNRILNPSL